MSNAAGERDSLSAGDLIRSVTAWGSEVTSGLSIINHVQDASLTHNVCIASEIHTAG